MDEQESHFLEHLTSELSLPSQEEAIPLVTSVMAALGQIISQQSAETLSARLPAFLKRYLPILSKDQIQVKVDHLDELVTLVMDRDKQNARSLFKSEIQTLAVILFTLKKLFSVVDPKIIGISQPIFNEVQEGSLGITI